MGGMDKGAGAFQQLMSRALDLHRRGGLAEAEALYAQALQVQPGDFEARHLLGVLRGQQGRYDEALALVRGALKTRPDSVVALSNQGLILHKMGRHQDALASFDQAIATRPDNAEAMSNRGNVLSELGRYQEALASYDGALRVKPGYAEALNNRGIALDALKRHEEALASFARALANRPDYGEALHNRGNALAALGRRDEALASYDRALALRPDYPEAHSGRASLLASLGRYEQALAGYERALAARPDDADTLYNCGNVLSELRRFHEALAAYDAALALRPEEARALENRGNALSKLKRYGEALASYDAALAIEPASARALTNRGTALENMRAYEDALASYDRRWRSIPAMPTRCSAAATPWRRSNATRRRSRATTGPCGQAGASRRIRLGRRRARHLRLAADRRPCGGARTELARGVPALAPFTLVGICDDPALHLACAVNYLKDIMPARPAPKFTAVRSGEGRLRIAYLSSDFRGHAVGYLIASLIEVHDRSRFEIVGLSFGPEDDGPMRRRFMAAFDQFHDVRATGDREVARLIETLGIDIAVDLNGHTQHARPEILGFRPAPVQVNFLGFPGTMGADFIDYIIADPIVLPFEQQPWFAEKIVYLPDCYQANNSQRRIGADAPTRTQAGLPENGFVFCCFNNNYKITSPIFDVWMSLLAATPGSVLWLLRDTAGAERNLRAQAQARGIAPARIVFAERADHDAHLSRHRLADLFLDTLPYNAHTTASDALRVGLPVVTCLGKAFPGRVAASLLHAAGVPELVTTSLAEYQAAALRLAADRTALDAVREKLRHALPTAPLFDADRFRRHIESAYATMWEIRQAGEAPRDFSVVPIWTGC